MPLKSSASVSRMRFLCLCSRPSPSSSSLHLCSFSIHQLLLFLPLRVRSLAFCPEVNTVMDVQARTDSDPRRLRAAGDGLWPGSPPVKSHDSVKDRLTAGGGGATPIQCFPSSDSGFLPECQTSHPRRAVVSALKEAEKKKSHTRIKLNKPPPSGLSDGGRHRSGGRTRARELCFPAAVQSNRAITVPVGGGVKD